MNPNLPEPVIHASRVKAGALAAFRVVRFVQATARSVPGTLVSTGRDVVEAWRESAEPAPKS